MSHCDLLTVQEAEMEYKQLHKAVERKIARRGRARRGDVDCRLPAELRRDFRVL